jgi:hypothetical protein
MPGGATRMPSNATLTHSPFSVLNLSQASFRVANTAALIIRCSVVAVCEICFYVSISTHFCDIIKDLTLSGWTFAIAFM